MLRPSTVASGTDHILALTAGGDVYSWGCGEKGRLGRLPEADADNTEKRDEAAKRKLLTPSRVPVLPAGRAKVLTPIPALSAQLEHTFE